MTGQGQSKCFATLDTGHWILDTAMDTEHWTLYWTLNTGHIVVDALQIQLCTNRSDMQVKSTRRDRYDRAGSIKMFCHTGHLTLDVTLDTGQWTLDT